MNWKMWAPLALAIVLGLVAAKFARDMLSKNHGPVGPPQKVTSVVVAKQGVRAGSELRAEDVGLGEVSGDVAPPDSFKSPTELVGRVVNVPLLPGQAVMGSYLAPIGSGKGLQAIVPAGMRAVTFEINETSGLAGWLVQGCHVDVMTTIQDNESGPIARTVVENIEVTAIGAPPPTVQQEGPPPAPRSVTLLTTPKQAAALELACSVGRPRLVLRGGLDTNPTENGGITLAELRGKSRDGRSDPFSTLPVEMTRPATRPADKTFTQTPARTSYERTVKIIRGASESNVVFDVPVQPAAGLMTGTDNSPVKP